MSVYRLFFIFIALFFTLFPTTAKSGSGNANKPIRTMFTLEQAIDLALKANRLLLGSSYSLESQHLYLNSTKSEFDLKIAPSTEAGFSDDEKNISAGVSLEKRFDFGARVSIFPRVGRSDDEYTGEIGLSLDMPLLKGFGKDVNLDSVRSSEYSLRTAQRALYSTKVSTVLNTVFAVYNIIEQRELVQLYKSQVERLKGHVEGARAKEKIGLATSIDIYRAEIRLKDAQDSLIKSYEYLRAAEDELKLILAIPLEKPISVSAPLDYKPIHIDISDAIDIAFNNRVELAQAKDAMQETKRKSIIAKHNLLPQLDLIMDYARYSSSDAFDQSMGFNEDRWSMNLVSTTDWARVSEKTTYQQSLLALRTSRLSLELERDEIKRKVRQQIDALKEAQERIKIREEQIWQAEGKLSLAKIKFSHGMADNFDIIEAETELQQARVSLLSVKIENITGAYRLRAVLGTLIER
jgi:outer membrane protein